MGERNNNNENDVSDLHWILTVGPVCRIVRLCQEAFLEHAGLRVSFSRMLAQHLVVVKSCSFFHQPVQ